MAKEGKYLNDDVLYEVLSRLPADTLVALKLVSKPWRALIADPNFSRAQLRRMEPSLSGLVFQQKYQWSDEDVLRTASYVSVTATPRVHHTVFDFLPDDVVVLASCHGLVCCRSCFPTRDPAIYVCNPANKQWLTIESPWLGRDCNIALAFDPSRNASFKVVIVEQFEINHDANDDGGDEETLCFEFKVYSSKTRVWTKSKSTCTSKLGLSKDKSVYTNGTLHWLTQGNKILTFQVEDELSLLISVPILAFELNAESRACIGLSKGSLHYATISEQGLSLWSLKEYVDSEWILEHWLSVDTMEQEYPRPFLNLRERVSSMEIPWVNPLAFEGNALVMRVGTKIYLYGFDSGEMRELCDVAELGTSLMFVPTVMPYSMSLFPLIH